jgi:hypothetical protein
MSRVINGVPILEYNYNYARNKPFKYLLNRCRSNSKEFKRFNSLTEFDIEQQWNKQKGLCYFSKHPMTFELGEFNKVSVDRLDSTVGYIKENIVLCCESINAMKSIYSINEFKFIVDLLTEGLKDVTPANPRKYRLHSSRKKKDQRKDKEIIKRVKRNLKREYIHYTQNISIFLDSDNNG